METVQVTPQLEIEELKIRKSATVLRAINHSLRQQIIQLLHQNKEMTVTQLFVKLRLEQSVASQHLAILRQARFVTTKRDGKFIYYSVNYSRLAEVDSFINDLINFKR